VEARIAVGVFLLNLIYRGQVDAAANALDTMWPPDKAGKTEFANDLIEVIRESWHGSSGFPDGGLA
jgi:hypothetical protein